MRNPNIPRCVNCDEKLPHFQFHEEARSVSEYGYRGDGMFCSLRCAHTYAKRIVNRLRGKQNVR